MIRKISTIPKMNQYLLYADELCTVSFMTHDVQSIRIEYGHHLKVRNAVSPNLTLVYASKSLTLQTTDRVISPIQYKSDMSHISTCSFIAISLPNLKLDVWCRVDDLFYEDDSSEYYVHLHYGVLKIKLTDLSNKSKALIHYNTKWLPIVPHNDLLPDKLLHFT